MKSNSTDINQVPQGFFVPIRIDLRTICSNNGHGRGPAGALIMRCGLLIQGDGHQFIARVLVGCHLPGIARTLQLVVQLLSPAQAERGILLEL